MAVDEALNRVVLFERRPTAPPGIYGGHAIKFIGEYGSIYISRL
jgi:hypothetical protein